MKRKHSDETKRKISETNKKKYQLGLIKPPNQKGFKMTDESKKKISVGGLKAYKEGRQRVNPEFYKKGKDSPSWKGGKINREGYVLVYVDEHPNATKDHYVREHRLVMEKRIGRYLKPEEVVHHINEVKDDNDMGNLLLFGTESKHQNFHYRLNRLRKAGDLE